MCVVPMGFGVYQAVTQRDEVERAIDACLQDVEAERADAALQRFSSRAIQNGLVTREQIEKLADDQHFRDYKSAHVTSIKVSQAFNTNPKVPQGTVANVAGTVGYNDGGTGVLQATLEKENGEWRLFALRVNRNNRSPASATKAAR